MSIPLWVLLGFAGWTLAVLLGCIGIYRWSRILTRRAELSAFPADQPHGDEWYRRAVRAHANCLENLPVYAAIVVVAELAGIRAPILDTLALVLLAARVCQSVVHIAVPQTNAVVGLRFGFFFMQIVCMVWMGVVVAMRGMGG